MHAKVNPKHVCIAWVLQEGGALTIGKVDWGQVPHTVAVPCMQMFIPSAMDPPGRGCTHIGEGGLGPGAAQGGQRGSQRVAGADDLRHIARRDA